MDWSRKAPMLVPVVVHAPGCKTISWRMTCDTSLESFLEQVGFDRNVLSCMSMIRTQRCIPSVATSLEKQCLSHLRHARVSRPSVGKPCGMNTKETLIEPYNTPQIQPTLIKPYNTPLYIPPLLNPIILPYIAPFEEFRL